MKVLFLGEIVGRTGLQTVRDSLKDFKKEKQIDFVIANGEGTTSGFGLGMQHAQTLFNYGVDVITGGEKIFFKIDMQQFIKRKNKILRPQNYPEGVPGVGQNYFDVNGTKVYVLNLLGTQDMNSTHLNNPFIIADACLKKAELETPFIFVNYHASTTAEKGSMGYHLAGRASAVIGTHSKVLTNDARILERGTAFITDNGRTGSNMSVGGFDSINEIKKFTTQIFVRSTNCFDDPRLQGVIVELDDKGKAVGIETINMSVELKNSK